MRFIKRLSSWQMCRIRYFSLSEISEKNSLKELWVVIHDKVYDVSKFAQEHPGGEEVLLESAGQDATENFEDVGHSLDARELLKKYCIGEVNLDERGNKKNKEGDKGGNSTRSNILPILISGAVIFAFIAIAAYFYLSKERVKS